MDSDTKNIAKAYDASKEQYIVINYDVMTGDSDVRMLEIGITNKLYGRDSHIKLKTAKMSDDMSYDIQTWITHDRYDDDRNYDVGVATEIVFQLPQIGVVTDSSSPQVLYFDESAKGAKLITYSQAKSILGEFSRGDQVDSRVIDNTTGLDIIAAIYNDESLYVFIQMPVAAKIGTENKLSDII